MFYSFSRSFVTSIVAVENGILTGIAPDIQSPMIRGSEFGTAIITGMEPAHGAYIHNCKIKRKGRINVALCTVSGLLLKDLIIIWVRGDVRFVRNGRSGDIVCGKHGRRAGGICGGRHR